MTAPVRDSYIALASTRIQADLNNVAGFVQKAQYPGNQNVARSEWGAIGNLRFFLSSIGAVKPNASMNGANIYDIMCVGLEAYAIVDQNGYNARFLYTPPAIADPTLHQNCNVGWKMSQVPVITNDLWVVNLQATLSS